MGKKYEQPPICEIEKLTKMSGIILNEKISTEQFNQVEIQDLAKSIIARGQENILTYRNIIKKCKLMNVAFSIIVFFALCFDLSAGFIIATFLFSLSTLYRHSLIKRASTSLFDLLLKNQELINLEFKKCVSTELQVEESFVSEIDSASHIQEVLKKGNNEELLSELLGEDVVIGLKEISIKFIKLDVCNKYLIVKSGVDWMVFNHNQWGKKLFRLMRGIARAH